MTRVVLFGLLLIGVLFPSIASAVTRDQAYAQCAARAALRDTQLPATAPNSCRVASMQPDGLKGSYIVVNKDGQDVGSLTFPWDGLGCPGQRWNELSKQCVPSEDQCKDRPPLGNVFTVGFGGSGSTCHDGCQYAPPVSYCTTTNGNKACTVSGGKATGGMCTAGDPPPTPEKPEECIPAGGGLTFCLKPDGQHCHTTSNGRQRCWQPGETGEKGDGPVRQKRDPGTEPKAPTPPTNGDTLIPSGPPVQTSTQVKDSTGVRDINTVVQNYNTSSGADAGGGGGDGNGDGGDDGDGDDDGPGGVGGGVGELYEGKGRTAADVFGEFKTRVTAAPIANAGTQFLTISIGGSCPVWTVPATAYWEPMVLDYHCSGVINDSLQLCGYLLLAVAAYQAFKWGFL